MWKFFVLLVGLSVFHLTLSENSYKKSDLVYVDLLTENYMATAKDIWNDIESNANLKDVIQKIHSEHLSLFYHVSNSFLTSEYILDRLFLNEKNLFYDKISEVNLRIDVVKENYLHDSADPESLKREIIEMAMHNSNTTLIDSIYDAVIGDDFFGYFKMVNKFIGC